MAKDGRVKKNLLSITISFVLLLVGTFYCLHYGRIGYMPQDHPAVFDGGYRILTGQIPFRDFTLSNAITPIFIQALFFKLFGMNWFVYCLHAAVFNGLFCVMVFFFIRLFGGTLLLSFFYALLSGVVFYPPFGIPVQDQHAYFFTFLLIFLACLSIKVSKPLVKQFIFFSLPLVTVIAFLSKQIPTIFGAALVCAIVVIAERRNLIELGRSLSAGILVTFLSLWALCHALGINFQLVQVYFFQLPAATGRGRIGHAISRNFIATLKYMASQWQLFLPLALVTILFLGILLLAGTPSVLSRMRPASPRWKGTSQRLVKNIFPLLVAQSLILICFLFVIITNNQIQNGVPLIFACIGLLHLFLQSMWGQGRNHDFAGQSISQQTLLLLMSIILYGGSLWCAWNFDRRVNATRMVHDFIYMKKADMSADHEMPEGLSFLIWGTPQKYCGTPANLSHIVDFFKRHIGNFYLLGDSSILYALTGRPSVNPVLWFHPGQTLPTTKSPLFSAFQDRLMEALRKYQVRYIVLEVVKNRKAPFYTTWSGVSLEYFPALRELVQKNGCERERFGPFTIIELVMPLETDSARSLQ